MVSASASAAMMIMLSWILPVASGWRPIACIAPLPMPPRPIPEPIAAMPMPIGSPSPSAAWKSIVWPPLVLVCVGGLRLPLVRVIVVRQHEEEVDRAQHREHQRLQRAGEKRKEQERNLPGNPKRQVRERQRGHAERGERHQQHVLAEDV